MRRALALTLAGCAVVDPLAEPRSVGPSPGVVATVVVEETLIEALLLEELQKPRALRAGGGGLPLVLEPRGQAVDLTLSPGPGPGQVRALARVELEVDASAPPFLRVPDVAVVVELDGLLELRTDLEHLNLRWAGPPTVKLALPEANPQLAALASGFDRALTQPVAAALAEPVRLATLPSTGVFGPLGVEATADGDLWIQILLPLVGAAEPSPVPADLPLGVVSDWGRLLAAGRAAALLQDPRGRYLFEPLALAPSAAGLTADLRWHRRSAKGKWRDLRAELTWTAEPFALELGPFERLGHHRWPGKGPLGILQRRVQNELSSWVVPDRIELPSLGRALRIKPPRAEADGLRLDLSLELLPAAP